MKNLNWRVLSIAAVMLASLICLMPTIKPAGLPPWWGKVFPKERIHLGLDLQGGMHLILYCDTEKAVENRVEHLVDEIKESLRNAHIAFRKVERAKGWNIDVQLAEPGQQGDVKSILEKDYPLLEWTGGESNDEGMTAHLTMKEHEVLHLRKMAEDQALETIRNRIDQFGVSEPDIRPKGEDRILVQLPGIKDTQRAIDLIGKTALLEFKLVAEDVTQQDIQLGKLPAGVKVYSMKRTYSPTSGGPAESKIALNDRTLMTGGNITNATVRIDSQNNSSYVSLEFDSQGARDFERITEANEKKRLAIVLDGTVYSAPVIQEKISGGKASITGSFTTQEAHDLSIVLRAGALPAPVKIDEERTVGSSLGSDSIHKGILASVVGGICVVAFMIIYYRISGIIADLALALNIIIVLAGLAAFQATLTLPGIAGIALTIAIAVDANVLIYERIREELRIGRTPRAAVETGYERATWTILDANITTLIAALVLFQFGTGPVKGFAVTLSIGLIANLFTAIIVTRVIFDYLLETRRMKTLSI